MDSISGFLDKINSNIILRDYEIPDPGEDEVTVMQHYTGVCFRDILTQQGFFQGYHCP